MAEAFVYDHIRTPRGKGKKVGSLHEVKPVDLVVGLLDEIKVRNPGLDPDAGRRRRARRRVPDRRPGRRHRQDRGAQGRLPRDRRPACSSTASAPPGLEAVNQAASRVRGGFEDLILAGGVESMSRVPMGSDGGAWAMDPATALKTGFVPQGIGADLIATIEGWNRDDVDAYAAESHHRAAKAWANGYFANAVVPVKDLNGLTVLDHDETIRPDTSPEGLAGAQAVASPTSARRPASTTWRWRSTTGSSGSTTSTTPATPRASSTAPRSWRSAASRSAPTSA